MIQIVKSLLGKCDEEFNAELQIILSKDNLPILSSDEQDVFKYLSKEYTNNKQFPTTEVFLTKFPQYRAQLNEFDEFSIADLRYYRKQFITKHLNIYKSKFLHKLATEAAVDGISPEMAEAIRKQASFDNDIVEENISFREKYTNSMKNRSGLKTFVDQIDDEIGSIPKGAMCTLAGFTGSFKCVSEHERILTNRGMLTIKEIFEAGVESGLEIQSEYGFKKLVAVHNEGVKESYIISINGVPIETSPVHRFRVLTDNGELIWKEAQNLSLDDKVVQSLKESIHSGVDDDPDFWRLYGQMCGDGGYTGDGYYLCGSVDTLDLMESERLFSKFFSKFYKTISAPRKDGYKSLFNLRAYHSTALREELHDFIGKTSKTKIFPEKLFYLSRECWEAFILGLYETDGCSGSNNLGFTLSNKQFLIDLSRLLSGMGISSALYHQENDAYRLSILTAKSRNRFIDLVGSVTFKANKNEKIDPIKDTCRPFMTRKAYLEAKEGLQLKKSDYKSFGRFGTTHGGCGFEKIRRVCESYPHFMKHGFFSEIVNAELTWNPVTSIERSCCYMYDLTVDGSPTYLLNGYVTHNTTWAANIAVKNVLEGKQVAYISLEVSKEQLEYSVMSLFSNDSRFTRMGYHPLELRKIMLNKLDADELNFLCDVLEPEYRKAIEPHFRIIDRTYFKTYNESEFVDILYRIDDEMPLDAIFVDHVGELALRSNLYNGNNTGAIINKYVSFFGGLTVAFRKKDGKTKQVATVLVAQTNRSGWKAAAASFRKLYMVTRPGDKNKSLNSSAEGYNLTALSDSNELERFSSIVMTVFADDNTKVAGQAYVQLLKTRYGTCVQPTPVDIRPEVYSFGGDASVDESELSVDLIESLSSCSVAQKSAGTCIYNSNSFDEDFGL